MELEQGNKIRIVLKSGYRYSGEVKETDDISIIIYDKFGTLVSLAKDSISVIEVLK